MLETFHLLSSHIVDISRLSDFLILAALLGPSAFVLGKKLRLSLKFGLVQLLLSSFLVLALLTYLADDLRNVYEFYFYETNGRLFLPDLPFFLIIGIVVALFTWQVTTHKSRRPSP